MNIAGLDIGTTGCKLAVYDGQAVLLSTYYTEYPATHRGGEHEIDFNAVRQGVLELLQRAAGEHRLDAVGVTSFGESFAMLDDRDTVLAPSMLYTDPRGGEECAALAAALGEQRITAITGTQPHPMYSLAKLLWHRAHNPALFARCRRVLLGQDYIVYTLTGTAQIDYSLAARTGALDIRRLCWSPEVFAAAGIDPALFSQPVPAGTPAGTLRPELARQLGIDYPVTVVSGCHDQVAAMLGSGVFSGDQAMDGTGTVECIPVLFDRVPQEPALYAQGYSVVPYPGGRYACYALSFTGGATLKWFRDTFAAAEAAEAAAHGQNIYALLDSRVPPQPTGLLVLPHFAGAATPYMDPQAKAAILGLTLETDSAAVYKALMEGTAFEIRQNFAVLQQYSGRIRTVRATGGGATSAVWLQIKADVLGTDITALACKEVGAAGTAALCGVAVGAYPVLSETVARMAPVRQIFHPQAENAAIYDRQYRQYAGLYRAIKHLQKPEEE